jgi:hypothetical protein
MKFFFAFLFLATSSLYSQNYFQTDKVGISLGYRGSFGYFGEVSYNTKFNSDTLVQSGLFSINGAVGIVPKKDTNFVSLKIGFDMLFGNKKMYLINGFNIQYFISPSNANFVYLDVQSKPNVWDTSKIIVGGNLGIMFEILDNTFIKLLWCPNSFQNSLISQVSLTYYF